MKDRISKSLVTAGMAVSMSFAAAVPAFAAEAEAHCPHGPTVNEAVECACIITATQVDYLLPGQTEWDCTNEIPI